jgi:hypothetical protein
MPLLGLAAWAFAAWPLLLTASTPWRQVGVPGQAWMPWLAAASGDRLSRVRLENS